jgi:hypothetical protein
VVAPTFEVLSLSLELVALSLYFFPRGTILVSHEIVIFAEKCPQEHRINCLTIILEESDLP